MRWHVLGQLKSNVRRILMNIWPRHQLHVLLQILGQRVVYHGHVAFNAHRREDLHAHAVDKQWI